MKLTILIPTVLAVALSACARTDDERNTAQQTTTPPAAEPAVPEPSAPQTVTEASAPVQGDALPLGLLVALNEHEIAAAKLAEEKKVTGPVLDFAKLMETQHAENLRKTQALGEPAQTGDVQEMKDKGTQELDTLQQKSGTDFEKAYMQAMVKGHQEALTLIDTKMVPAATSDAVRAHLSDTRGHVEDHLKRAEKIQAGLQ